MIDPSQPLPSERHEAFAVHYTMNGNASKAWLAAGGKNPQWANRQGDKWADKGDIPARVAWLKAEADRKLKEQASKASGPVVLTIMRKRIILATIAEDGARDADRINAIKTDNDLSGEGSEAAANAALGEVALAALDRIFGKAS